MSPLVKNLKNRINFFRFENYKQYQILFFSGWGRQFHAGSEAQICLATALHTPILSTYHEETFMDLALSLATVRSFLKQNHHIKLSLNPVLTCHMQVIESVKIPIKNNTNLGVVSVGND